MVLSPDFKEFIELLNAHEVRYLVIGGYAVAFHGHPRYTKDLDVWIDATLANAKQLFNVLNEFGFGGIGLSANDFATVGNTVQLGYPPNRIDILTVADGVDFDDCFQAYQEVIIDDIPIKFIDRNNLRRNKQASGRFQDLADLEKLE